MGNAVPVAFGRLLGLALIAALQAGERPRPESAPFPPEFLAAMTYTRREQAGNGASRAEVRRRVREGSGPNLDVKGLGAAGHDSVGPKARRA